MALVKSNLTCSKSCYRCLSYQKRGQESLVSLILIHWIEIYHVDNAIHLLNNRVWIPNFKPLNWFRISLHEKNSRVPGIRITVHLGYPLLKVFWSVALEIRAGNKTWYLGGLDGFLWKCYPRKRIHCTCHLVTLNIFHWVKNLRCHLCFLLVRILDGCYFL